MDRFTKNDIDINNDPIHAFVFGQFFATIVVGTIKLSMSKGRPQEEVADDMDDFVKQNVAAFLNDLESRGYSIVKKEPIPEAFLK